MVRTLVDVGSIAVAILLTVGAWLALSRFADGVGDSPPAKKPVMAVETTPVRFESSVVAQRTYTGRVVPRRAVDLAFVHSGQIVAMAVQEGDRVRSGQPLARLDGRRLEAQQQEQRAARSEAAAKLAELIAGARRETIAAARSRVSELTAEVAQLEVKLRRREALIDRRTITKEAYDEIAFGAATSRARLEAAQSELDRLLAGTRSEQIERQQALVEQIDAKLADLDVQLDQSELKAPFSGRIAARLVEEGAVVSGSQPVYRLVDENDVEVWIGAPVSSAAELAPGTSGRVWIGNAEYEYAVVTHLPEIDAPTLTVTVILRINQPAGSEVQFGQLAKLTLEKSVDARGCWLPITALTRATHGLWSCFAVATDESREAGVSDQTGRNRRGHIERRNVEAIHAAGDRVFVRGALIEGERIVSTGTHRIVPGQSVRIVH